MSFNKQIVTTLQSRLAALGWYRLNIDGKPGVGTKNALSNFKEAHGLRPRPYPGPKTCALLFSGEAKQAPKPKPIKGEAPWLAEARRLLGTREVRGPKNNPVIMDWAKGLDQWYPGDDVPWCGLFVAHCMTVGAPHEPQAFNRLGARNWMKYGEADDKKNPSLGAIGVLWRTHKTRSWNGHVFIVTGQSETAIRGIGGNQSDNVTEAWFSRDRVLGFRLPEGAEAMPAPMAKTGQLSTNEA